MVLLASQQAYLQRAQGRTWPLPRNNWINQLQNRGEVVLEKNLEAFKWHTKLLWSVSANNQDQVNFSFHFLPALSSVLHNWRITVKIQCITMVRACCLFLSRFWVIANDWGLPFTYLKNVGSVFWFVLSEISQGQMKGFNAAVTECRSTQGFYY